MEKITKEEIEFYLEQISTEIPKSSPTTFLIESALEVIQDNFDILDDRESNLLLEGYKKIFSKLSKKSDPMSNRSLLIKEAESELSAINDLIINPINKSIKTTEKLILKKYILTNDKISSIARQAEKSLSLIEKQNKLSRSLFEDAARIKKQLDIESKNQEEKLLHIYNQIDIKLQESQAQTDDFLKSRRDSFISLSEKLRTDFNLKLDASSKENLEKCNEAIAPAVETANSQLEKINSIKTSAEEILGVISQGATENHYEKAYKSERTTRIFWQALASLGFIAIAIIAYMLSSTITTIQKDGLQPEAIVAILFKSSSVFIAIFFIRFCNNNANKHHELEKFNRQVRLELLTLDGYLTSVKNEAERESAKLMLKDHFFGLTKSIMDKNEPQQKPDLDQLTKAFEAISKVVNKKADS